MVAVWVLAPHIDGGRNEEPPPENPYPESDPERVDRLNEIIRRVADERQSAVTVDLPGYLSDQPGGEMDEGLRSDGVHFDLETAYEVSADWLGQAVLDGIDAEPNLAAPAAAGGGPRGASRSRGRTGLSAAARVSRR